MPEEKAGEDVAPAVFVTEPLQYTDALPQPRDVQAGPFVGSGPLQAELRTRMNPDASRTVSAGDAWPLRVLVSILWQPGRGAVAHRIWVDEIICLEFSS